MCGWGRGRGGDGGVGVGSISVHVPVGLWVEAGVWHTGAGVSVWGMSRAILCLFTPLGSFLTSYASSISTEVYLG